MDTTGRDSSPTAQRQGIPKTTAAAEEFPSQLLHFYKKKGHKGL
jgi:hypothetical protein